MHLQNQRPAHLIADVWYVTAKVQPGLIYSSFVPEPYRASEVVSLKWIKRLYMKGYEYAFTLAGLIKAF